MKETNPPTPVFSGNWDPAEPPPISDEPTLALYNLSTTFSTISQGFKNPLFILTLWLSRDYLLFSAFKERLPCHKDTAINKGS